MKKYLAMLLAVVMVFALGASAFAADTGDTYSSYTFTDFNLTVQVSTTVEGLTLSGSGRSATIAPVTDHEMPQGFSLIFSNANGTNFDVNSVTVTTTNAAAFAFNTEGDRTRSTVTALCSFAATRRASPSRATALTVSA